MQIPKFLRPKLTSFETVILGDTTFMHVDAESLVIDDGLVRDVTPAAANQNDPNLLSLCFTPANQNNW